MKNTKFLFIKKSFLLIYGFFIINGLTLKAQCWKSVTASSEFTVAIAENGTLWSWGTNLYGELGLGYVTQFGGINTPTQIGSDSDWQYITTKGRHTLALKTNGTLWTWGSGTSGELGNGQLNEEWSPIQIGTDTDWQSFALGTSHCLALKTNGTIWVWGSNSSGQLGIGSTPNYLAIPTQLGTATNWQSIGAGGNHSLAIKTDGTLWVWGTNGWGQLGLGNYTTKYTPTKLGTATNWEKIVGLQDCSIAKKIDGTLWGWGRNASAELGDATGTNRLTPVQIGGGTNDWQNIFCGSSFTFAIKTDGTLWGWGSNDYGQLGNGTYTFTPNLLPQQISSDTNWLQIDAGWYHSTIIKSDHSLWVSGDNGQGELGLGSFTPSRVNVFTQINCPSLGFAIIEENQTEFSIYPNPTSDFIKILNPSNWTIKMVSIEDFSGRNLFFTNSNFEEIDVHLLSQGVYFFNIFSDESKTTIKFIKK